MAQPFHQKRHRPAARLGPVHLDAGKSWRGALADVFDVVDAHDGEVVRNGGADSRAGGEDKFAHNVVGGEDAARPRQGLEPLAQGFVAGMGRGVADDARGPLEAVEGEAGAFGALPEGVAAFVVPGFVNRGGNVGEGGAACKRQLLRGHRGDRLGVAVDAPVAPGVRAARKRRAFNEHGGGCPAREVLYLVRRQGVEPNDDSGRGVEFEQTGKRAGAARGAHQPRRTVGHPFELNGEEVPVKRLDGHPRVSHGLLREGLAHAEDHRDRLRRHVLCGFH